MESLPARYLLINHLFPSRQVYTSYIEDCPRVTSIIERTLNPHSSESPVHYCYFPIAKV